MILACVVLIQYQIVTSTPTNIRDRRTSVSTMAKTGHLHSMVLCWRPVKTACVCWVYRISFPRHRPRCVTNGSLWQFSYWLVAKGPTYCKLTVASHCRKCHRDLTDKGYFIAFFVPILPTPTWRLGLGLENWTRSSIFWLQYSHELFFCKK